MTAENNQPFTSPDIGPAQGPEMGAVHNQEATTAIDGLRQFITRMRLVRAVDKLEKLKSNDQVIRHAPIEAQTLRGFGTVETLRPDDQPIGIVQNRAFRHRGSQATKRRRQQREQYRISQVYGDLNPVDSGRSFGRSNSGTAAGERWNNAARKLEELDRGTVASFDLESRASRKERRAERRAQTRYSKAGLLIDNIDQKLSRGIEGSTIPGKQRKKRIEKQRRKIEKLQSKLR